LDAGGSTPYAGNICKNKKSLDTQVPSETFRSDGDKMKREWNIDELIESFSLSKADLVLLDGGKPRNGT